MRILVAHNFYQQPGGEDQVFQDETALLARHGHEPLRYLLHNSEIERMPRALVAGKAVWNRRVHRDLAAVLRAQPVDVVHFHNTFPLISPAAYSAARQTGAAVVQTLHNFRLLCPAGVLFRDQHDCEECLHRRLKLPAIRHRCYRGSATASTVVTAVLAFHHWRGTWSREVDLFITPSASARAKFLEAGMRPEHIVVKPHFVDPDPGCKPGGNYAVFAGRLSPEKGLDTLLTAWQQLGGQVPLKIVGDGPLGDQVRAAIRSDQSIQWLGRQSLEATYSIIGHAAFIIVPSTARETFGRVVIEAFATGTPAIVANHGGLAEIVAPQTGMTFQPGDAADLARCVRTLLACRDRWPTMRAACRTAFEERYTAEQNYHRLIGIYRRAIELANARPAGIVRPRIEDSGLPVPHNQQG